MGLFDTGTFDVALFDEQSGVNVIIGGEYRTPSIVFNTLRKTDNLNQQVDNLSFTIRKYGTEHTYEPEIGEEVIIYKAEDVIFGGVIVKIKEVVRAANIIEYEVTCNDYSQFLKRQLVTERYVDMDVKDIVDDIIANYTDEEFTTDNVYTGQTIRSISFNRLTVSECLQKLADAISFVWYVDYVKDVHFFPKNEELSPFNLTDTSGNYIYNSLEINEDITQIKNSVLVQGGDQTSENTRTEVFSGDGTRNTFALANKFSAEPVVEVGGVPQTVGLDNIDDDASFDCMWNYNEKYIRFTSGNTPGAGTNNIEVTQTYRYPIVVAVPAPASIAQFGTYEFAITDKTIESQQEAIDRALAELTSFKNQLYEGGFRTYDDGLRSGQVITITSTLRNKSISVLIQSVSASMRDPEGLYFEYDVRFATLKSIGIVEYLQRQLRNREVVVDDEEILLQFQTLSDEIGFSDTLDAPIAQTSPYVWSNDPGSTPKKLVWGFGVWQ